MKVPKGLIGVGILAITGLSLLFVLPEGGLTGITDLHQTRVPAPPELRLASPSDGDGVRARVTLAGEASSATREIVDVQYRIDSGRWQSAPLTMRGQRSAPFQVELDLSQGDHILEVRAFDGEATSIPARAEVRRDAPTTRIIEPPDGAGVPVGKISAAGLVRGGANAVLLILDGETTRVPVRADGLWRAELNVTAGSHELRAIAVSTVNSLPAVTRFAAGAPAPPTLTILSPPQNAAYGEMGDLACGAACILFKGAAPGAARVTVEVDGLPGGAVPLSFERVWDHRIPMRGLASGMHEVVFTPIDESGQKGEPRTTRFLARTSTTLLIEGADKVEPSGTPITLKAIGENVANATWSIDGEPAARGDVVTLSFPKPGDHVLSVQTPGARGNAASASATVHVVNRLPQVAFLSEPFMVDGRWRFDVAANDPDGRLIEYRWDFGDGTQVISLTSTVFHRYRDRGSYTVSVVAIDDHGGLATIGATLVIPNAPPTAAFAWSPAEPTVLDVVTFQDDSIDHDGTLVERVWRFDDGNTSDDASPIHRFRARGPHEVSLRVVDDAGEATLLRQTVHVANLPPATAFRFDPPVALSHQEVLFADASTDVDGNVTSWSWDFGDGSTGSSAQTLHIFRVPGHYDVKLTATDDGNATASTNLTIVVVDSAPEIRTVVLEPPRPIAQQLTRLRVVAEDRDGNIVAASWKFGDGTQSNETEPTHRYPKSGFYTGEITVIDEAGLRATFPFHVDVDNAPPLAELFSSIRPTAAYPTTLLANATDPGGRVTFYRFDADDDGVTDCETTEALCEFVYERAGIYAARLWVEDDEGATTEATLLIEVAAPPSDHPPPRVLVEAPAPRITLRGDHLFRGTTAGVRDVVTVDMQLRTPEWAYSGSRDPWRLATGTEDWHVLIDTKVFMDGEYDLVIRATDTLGGTGYARVPVTVANGPRLSQVFLRLMDPPPVIDTDVAIRGSAFHPEGVTSVRWRLDTGDWNQETESPLAFTLDIDREGLKPGEHVLRVEAYHGITERASATHAFTVPGVRPVLIVDLPPDATAHALLRAEGRIVGEGRAQWKVDQGLWQDLPAGAAWRLAEDTLAYRTGNHTLHLRAVSHDGRLVSDVHTYRTYIINPPFSKSITNEPEPARAEVPVPWVMMLAAGLLAAGRRRAR